MKPRFKRTINWYKYQSKVSKQTKNEYLDYMIDLSFQEVNRIFILLFGNEDELFYSLLVTRYYLLVSRQSLIFTHYSLLFTRYLLLLTCYSLLFASHSVHFTHYLFLFTRYSLLLSCYFLCKTFRQEKFRQNI